MRTSPKTRMHSSLEAEEASAEWRVQQLGGIRASRTSDDSVASDAVYTTRYTSVSRDAGGSRNPELMFPENLTGRVELCARRSVRS